MWIKDQSSKYLMCCVYSPREGAPFFWRGGALQEEAAYLLRGGAPLTLWLFHLLIDWERWQPLIPHLALLHSPSGVPPSPNGAPSSFSIFPSWLYIEVFNHCKRVGVWGLMLVVVYFCNTFILE